MSTIREVIDHVQLHLAYSYWPDGRDRWIGQRIVLHCVVLCCIVLYYFVLCCILLCCVELSCFVLRCCMFIPMHGPDEEDDVGLCHKLFFRGNTEHWYNRSPSYPGMIAHYLTLV